MGVFLLRHDAAGAAISVRDVHETKLVGVPDEDIGGESFDIRHQSRHYGESFDAEVQIRIAVLGIGVHRSKTHQFRRALAIQSELRPRARSATHGAYVATDKCLRESLKIAFESSNDRDEVVT